jgi:subtilisin family serine protease
VVAVLDTGVRAHPWLDVAPDPVLRYRTVPDGFVAVDEPMQAAIYAEDLSAAAQGDQPRQLIKDPWDRPVTGNPLIGELDEATGHGSFIAGIVRQVAPDARVLAIRIMHSDDVVYESDLINALTLIADRVAFAQAGHMEDMVDVVSLSLGYFDESPADALYTSGLWMVIQRLLGMGVAVFASAGNSATSQMCFPAAFAVSPAPGPVRLISVGALNPDGTKALFSNDGQWVRAWADGAALVSTFPVDIDGSCTPPVRVPARPRPGKRSVDREALDLDDFRSGFATWSGTSFSAPLLAANLAAQLLKNAIDAYGPALDQPGEDAAMMRVAAALTAMRDRGADRDG